jgi:hypothetical protein
MWIYLKSRKPFTFPGLWDFWLDRDTGSQLYTFNHHHASERAGAATPRSDARDLRRPRGPPVARAAVRQPGAALDLVLQRFPPSEWEAHEFRRWSTTGERLGGCIQPVSSGQLRKSQLSLFMRL